MRIASRLLRTAVVFAPVFAMNVTFAASPSTKPTKSVTAPVPAVLTDSNYELGGFFGAGANMEVSLKTSAGTGSKWVQVGRKSGNVFVESADSQKGFAIVKISGVRYRLNLRGEKPSRLPDDPTAPSETSVTPVTEKSLEREKLREQFELLIGRLSVEQRRLIWSKHQEKFGKELETNPAFARAGADSKEFHDIGSKLLKDSYREVLTMPDKEGKPGTVPANFNDLYDARYESDAD